ncbi:hypothetical protein V6N13_104398 [Hibiscus sabdariffa]|uniref:Uncharacterized protein n=2 Tax=Hibiscus sabdariffa TaxID=183260 RepID=A0ABR2NEC6_9ROSI
MAHDLAGLAASPVIKFIECQLLLGAIDYGVDMDLWSACCILAELLAGRPIMPGRTEIANADGVKKAHPGDGAVRAVPAPEANAELQANLDRQGLITQANANNKSEKFPPPHQDGTIGYPLDVVYSSRREKHMSGDGHSRSKSSTRDNI